jgi:hypothetical protein
VRPSRRWPNDGGPDTVLDAREPRVAAGRHIELATALGLTPAEDTVAVAFRVGRRLPADMQRVIDSLITRGLLDEERAREWLGLDQDDFAAWRRVRQTSAVEDELPDDEAGSST